MKKNLLLLLIALGLNWQISMAQTYSPTYSTPPTAPNIRTMAEWEEIEALVVTWTGVTGPTDFPNILTQIIKHAKEECKVIVICNNSNDVITYLSAFNIDTVNVEFVEDAYNSVWIRDYGASTIYGNYVDSLYLVDWIYNRQRPLDDRIPQVVSGHINVPLYGTTTQPYDLVHTGGNFMNDGQGTAFSSRLIIDENGPNGTFNNTIRSEDGIDSIMQEFMGIHRFIKTEQLVYNAINHIDMYMKLLDEETLLVGEYPLGVADGTQIEANIQYIQDNFTSTFGTPYDIVRIPMPPDSCGNYPDYIGASCYTFGGNYYGHYRTFTNLVFVNKTVLVPVYSWQYDTTAFRILQEHLPGYKLVGIDCDEMIPYGGALHCITRAIGARNPLLIVHQPLGDTSIGTQGLPVIAKIQHRDLIDNAQIFYRTNNNQSFTSIPMTNTIDDYWQGIIPQLPVGTKVEYYIKALSFSGKEQVRPITAPDGFWTFRVDAITNVEQKATSSNFTFNKIYPNPSGDKVFIPLELTASLDIEISIFNLKGQKVRLIHQGQLPAGQSLLEIAVNNMSKGTYYIVVETLNEKFTQSLIVGK